MSEVPRTILTTQQAGKFWSTFMERIKSQRSYLKQFLPIRQLLVESDAYCPFLESGYSIRISIIDSEGVRGSMYSYLWHSNVNP